MSIEPPVKIYLTGRLTVEGPEGAFDESALPGNQARVALAALVHDRMQLSRDSLADRVWGEQLPEGWSGSLSALISKTRSLLAGCGLDAKAILRSAAGSYEVTLPPGGWVDLEDAIRRLDRSEGHLRHGDLAAALPDATVASAILRRPFLRGSDGEWVDDVRRRNDAALYRCYEVLSEGWRAQGDHGLAAIVASQAIELDPFHETGHRLLMEAELARGDAIAALRAFDRCERMVMTEFGASPSQRTCELAKRARRL
ncbi:MAG: AfsR/SARP family transcriptional regulator [Acidimicrobiales bacterium]